MTDTFEEQRDRIRSNAISLMSQPVGSLAVVECEFSLWQVRHGMLRELNHAITAHRVCSGKIGLKRKL